MSSKSNVDYIVDFFSEKFLSDKGYDLPASVVKALNDIDRAERGELKSRLFNEAKRLGQGSDAVKAIRWLENAFDLIEKNSFRMHEVLFSPGQDIPENIAFHISRATKTLDLCVYTISDELLGQCIKAVHKRGVKVRLITDNNKMHDTGSQVKDLARAGISVKVDNSKYHMHNKFGLIDGRIAFTGSYNWTYTAKAFNQENLVITTNYTIVHAFMNEFEQLWDQMFTLRVKQRRDGRLHASISNGTIHLNADEIISPDDEDERHFVPQLNPTANTQDYKTRAARKAFFKNKKNNAQRFDKKEKKDNRPDDIEE